MESEHLRVVIYELRKFHQHDLKKFENNIEILLKETSEIMNFCTI